ncbi:MAG: hypothetical protein ABIA04_13630 [Pseudomonadota bacterium]
MNNELRNLIDGEKGLASLDSWIFYDDISPTDDFEENNPFNDDKKKRGRKKDLFDL